MSIYDPEIDPSIREQEEELLREQEEQRLRDERRAELRTMLNDLLDEREAKKQPNAENDSADNKLSTSSNAPSDEEPTQESEPERPAEPKKRTRRNMASKTVKDIVSGGILSNPKVRRYYPYLIGFGILIVAYLMSWFSVQRLQHTRQVLEKQLRTIRTEAVTISSEAKQMTNRSNITKRITALGIELEESTEPVRVIEK